MKKAMKKLSFTLFAALSLTAATAQTPKNIILMIGDGMGPAHVTALVEAQAGTPVNMERPRVGGLVKTSSANDRVTDSAAAGTAYATGHKTNDGSLGVCPHGRRLESILEKAERAGLATGLVVTTTLSDATPAAFYAHVADRNDKATINAQFAEANIEVAAEYVPDLAAATDEALKILATDPDGFFLMVEGSNIDKVAHDNDGEAVLRELRDFDAAVGVALDWAEAHPETLVVITADHETGAFTLPEGDGNRWIPRPEGYRRGIEFRWGAHDHTASMVPIFAFGPGAESFGGIQENTAVNHKMTALLSLN